VVASSLACHVEHYRLCQLMCPSAEALATKRAMLISLILLVASLLSWLSSGADQVAGPFGKPSITPQDPSTLTLALIGAGTLGVYFAISRRAWRRRAADVLTGCLNDQSAQPAATTPSETEERRLSRGAA
jgi:hypothetical protein